MYYLCNVIKKTTFMKKILVRFGLISIFVLSWISLWWALVGFIFICISMLIAILECGSDRN